MGQEIKCRVVAVGKRRDGGTRYWCLEHRADATAKYGRRAKLCRYAHVPALTPDEILDLNPSEYKGGVALWGAVPPVYDTTERPIDRGIHVHARREPDGPKVIDHTYRAVRLIGGRDGLPAGGLVISELEAIYYMVTSVFGYQMKYVPCTLCGHPHLDKDWFSVHAHRRHLCAGCGQYFRDEDTAVGNPIMQVREVFGVGARPPKRAAKTINIRQADYPGGIQIWGSNAAFLWTGLKREEEGIHVHGVCKDGGRDVPDDTFSRVTVDGIKLDPAMVRTLMAQNALPHIAGRVKDVNCPSCGVGYFDTGEAAFTPHDTYTCGTCGHTFPAKGKLRKTIGNPMVGVLARLAEGAPRPPRKHDLNLLPETL
jgi:transposase-like protein